jgi:hypothetical protein
LDPKARAEVIREREAISVISSSRSGKPRKKGGKRQHPKVVGTVGLRILETWRQKKIET